MPGARDGDARRTPPAASSRPSTTQASAEQRVRDVGHVGGGSHAVEQPLRTRHREPPAVSARRVRPRTSARPPSSPAADHRPLALGHGRDDRARPAGRRAPPRPRPRSPARRRAGRQARRRASCAREAQPLADALQLDRDRALGARGGVRGLLGRAPAVAHGRRLGREPLELGARVSPAPPRARPGGARPRRAATRARQLRVEPRGALAPRAAPAPPPARRACPAAPRRSARGSTAATRARAPSARPARAAPRRSRPTDSSRSEIRSTAERAAKARVGEPLALAAVLGEAALGLLAARARRPAGSASTPSRRARAARPRASAPRELRAHGAQVVAPASASAPRASGARAARAARPPRPGASAGAAASAPRARRRARGRGCPACGSASAGRGGGACGAW